MFKRIKWIAILGFLASIYFPIFTSAIKADKQTAKSCETAVASLKRPQPLDLQALKSMKPREAWEMAYSNFKGIQSVFIGEGIESILFSLLVGAIAQEFIWISGGSGSGKTSVAKIFYTNLLLGLPYEIKRNFFIQMHKLVTENVITGNPKINKMLKGMFERNFDQSLVNSEFRTFIIDEIDKSHTGLQASLLSLLAERAAFAGDLVIMAGIETGAFTSNKTIGQLMESYGLDAPTGEAMVDRMGIKGHAVNQQLDVFAKLAMYRAMKMQKDLPDMPLPLVPLRQMMNAVKIPDYLLADIIQAGNEFDIFVLDKRQNSLEEQMDPENEKAPYFPANQFSNRSWGKILKIAKASFITEQLLSGIPYEEVRFTMDRQDLYHIATASAYIGPGRLRRKWIPLKPIQFFTSLSDLAEFNGLWYPATGEVVLKERNGTKQLRLKLNKESTELKIMSSRLGQTHPDDIDLDGVKMQVLGAIATANKDPKNKTILDNPEGVAVDPIFAEYLGLRGLPTPIRDEIESNAEDQERLVKIINDQLQRPQETKEITKAVRQKRAEQLKAARTSKRQFKGLVESNNVEPETMWPLNVATVREALNTFPEMDHVIRSLIMTMIGNYNALLFGPPGGAKTAISKAMIDAELESANKVGVAAFISRFLKKFEGEHPKEFKKFMLQCHQLMPEGQIIGFQNIDAQLEEDGKLEWNVDYSIAAKNVLYGIIDEVEKGHSALGATLLSVMEEREIFTGAERIKATILSIILTSNKTPSEFLEMYDIKDLPTALAFLERSAQKVYVANKFADPAVQVEYLAKLENGLKPILYGPLALNYIKPIVKSAVDRLLNGIPEQGEAPNERVVLLGLTVADLLNAEQLRKQEESYRKHLKEPIVYSDYYFRAISGSNRTVEATIDLWITAKIVDQLIKGVPYDKLSTQLTFKDLGLLVQALAYSGPYEIVVNEGKDNDGFISFELDASGVDSLIASKRLDKRNVNMLKDIRDEADTFVSILNSTLSTFQQEHRDEIQKYPHLFPEIRLPVPVK